jgi:polysaccharide deacetylase 2 family uncharacterized protein YibQ
MFARRPVPATPLPSPSSGFALPAILNKPWALPAGAAALALGVVGLVLIATANPHAGAPVVTLSLEAPKPPTPVGPLRPALDPATPATLTTLAPGQDVGMPGAPADPLMGQFAAANAGGGGEAVITLPQGGSIGGGPARGGPPTQPSRPKAAPLPIAPLVGLSAPGPGGLLPIIGKDGRTPFAAYARPFQPNGKPKIALVVGGLGLNGAATRAAIEKLPPDVTLSFVPYADGLQGWIDLARANGHEVMLEIPMEPLDYPANDPGPYTLMTAAQPAETIKRLEWLLARTTGYFAVTNYLGGRFVTSDAAMNTLAGALRTRGLGLLDDGSAISKAHGAVPRGSADAVVDETLSADAIDAALHGLEARALQKGQALGTGFAYPVTVDEVSRWAAAIANRGFQLAPASAVMRK